MPAYARRVVVAEGEVGTYHCTARCVRHAVLCGRDPLTGRDYEHRKRWIHGRLKFLAGVFAAEVCGFAVLRNQLQVVLRTRPDVCQRWSDTEIARRWWRVFPKRRDEAGEPAKATAQDLNLLMESSAARVERRKRLASVSWFMRTLCEPIARRANKDDGCGGRFWEGRFKCMALLDEAAMLACSLYVDLSPILTDAAPGSMAAFHTSALDRIAAGSARSATQANRAARGGGRGLKKQGRQPDLAREAPDGWLSPMAVQDKSRARTPAKKAATAWPRATDRPFLSLEPADYLRLLDWTGRQLRREKQGAIPADLRPILDRLCVNGDTLVETVRKFDSLFHRAAGRADSMESMAADAGRQWFQGLRGSKAAFR